MKSTLCLLLLLVAAARVCAGNALVMQTDFGTKDGAVAAMRGIAFGVDAALPIFDLSHENTPYDIWEVSLPYEKPTRDGGAVKGTIPLIDFHYGNVWTNIPDSLFNELKPAFGGKFVVVIFHDGKEAYRGTMPYVRTFGDVKEGEPLLYLNSLMNVAFALNMGSFSAKHGLSSGGGWTVRVERAR